MFTGRVLLVAVAACSLPGCSTESGGDSGREPLGSVGIDLTKDQRIARYKKMKAAAAAKGVPNNAYLLAGIAYAETGQLLSKLDGANWWTRVHGQSSLVDTARRAQQQGTDLGTPDVGAHRFVTDCVAILQAAS